VDIGIHDLHNEYNCRVYRRCEVLWNPTVVITRIETKHLTLGVKFQKELNWLFRKCNYVILYVTVYRLDVH